MTWIKAIIDGGVLVVLAFLIHLNAQKDKQIFGMLTDFTKLLQKIADALDGVKEELKCLREKANGQ